MLPNLDNLNRLFEKMSANGFNVNSALKWGFYFVDHNKEKLKKLFTELEPKGYILENIYQVEEDENEWTLHVSKIDTLTAEKLHKRNIAFNELADYCGVSFYDGWDVEKLASNDPTN